MCITLAPARPCITMAEYGALLIPRSQRMGISKSTAIRR